MGLHTVHNMGWTSEKQLKLMNNDKTFMMCLDWFGSFDWFVGNVMIMDLVWKAGDTFPVGQSH